MKRQKTLLSPGGWTALLLLLALGLWEATAAAGYVDPFFSAVPACSGRNSGPCSTAACWPVICPSLPRRPGWVCCWAARWAPWPAWAWGSLPGSAGP